ncbi:Tol biopolymer transport system, TolR protein [hydrothermal vent metagenome]|uniref:Tol biopolymer transport system, TolR protein n=1 Tax=hydrothermal vent metagenome TaxID=652676 RepID=A0A3B0T5H3_9ZZZZ
MGAYSGGRRQGRGRYAPMAEINVTPMVDVMLVLLIVFMIAAPLLTVGVPIELPETKAKQLSATKEPLTVSVTSEGKVFLQDNEIPIDEIVPKLLAISEGGFEERIFVRGDRSVSYGQVMRVMARISSAGFKSIGLVTDIENN